MTNSYLVNKEIEILELNGSITTKSVGDTLICTESQAELISPTGMLDPTLTYIAPSLLPSEIPTGHNFNPGQDLGDATESNQEDIIDDIEDVQDVVDDIEVDTQDIQSEVAGLDGDAMRGTDNGALAAVATDLRLAELDPANMPADVDAINAVTSALPILTETNGVVAGAGGGEQNIVIENAPAGVWFPKRVKVSLENMIGGDTTIFRVYNRLSNGGAMELVSYETYTGVDGGLANGLKAIIIDLSENRWGLRITLDEDVGGTRNYVWEYLYEAV